MPISKEKTALCHLLVHPHDALQSRPLEHEAEEVLGLAELIIILADAKFCEVVVG
jgi:hypothetical protein